MGIISTKLIRCYEIGREKFGLKRDEAKRDESKKVEATKAENKIELELKEFIFDHHDYDPKCKCIDCYYAEWVLEQTHKMEGFEEVQL